MGELMKVLLTGATGFFGKHVQKALSNYELFAVGSKDYDLLEMQQAEAMFRDIQPQIVVHLAAKVGGILANKSYPAEFWFKNMLMTTHIWELSKKYSIDKMIYIMPGCAYPKTAPSPIKETSLWDGYPDEFPAPGALAKKMGLVASYAYKKQYGLHSCVLIPANMFGEFDCFDEYNSHVIPALILKMHKAKKTNTKEITLWGSGKAIRDFIYAEDVAKCIPTFIENTMYFAGPSYLTNVCNISTGVGVSIRELAETIAQVVEYKGNILWDTSKPEGPLNKIFDNERMKLIDLECNTPLIEGIRKTYQWYINQYA